MGQPITIVVGGQYGSESKGLITGHLSRHLQANFAVRTGATNAGHTVIYKGARIVLQQLPCGFVHPSATLVLGAGSLIDPTILDREVKMLTEVTGEDVRRRLKIDYRAGLHTPAHTARSKASGRHHRMGATGKGCSEALIDRIRDRGSDAPMLFGTSPYARDYDVCDTERLLNDGWDAGAKIILEGTQGQLLDLYLGPYPYVTHKQTGPAQWLLECGLSPSLPTEIVMTIRTFPIRVAGNSGPLPDEMSWPQLARDINASRHRFGMESIVKESTIVEFEEAVRVSAVGFRLPSGSDGLDQHLWSPEDRVTYREAVSELNRVAIDSLRSDAVADIRNLFEMTTVTKKLRRVAHLNLNSLRVASRQIRPNSIAITFMNYLFPETWYTVPAVLSMDAQAFVTQVEEVAGAPVTMLSWGPNFESTVVTGTSVSRARHAR